MKPVIGITSRAFDSNELYFGDPFKKFNVALIEINLNYSFPPIIPEHFESLLKPKTKPKYSIHSTEVTVDGRSKFLEQYGALSMKYATMAAEQLKAENIIFHWLPSQTLEKPTPQFEKAVKQANVANNFTLENNESENPFRHPENMLGFADKLDLQICIDTGHLLRAYANNFLEHIPEGLPERTNYMHVHDNHFKQDEHLALGKGKADVDKILQLIDLLQPKTIVAETNTLEDALITVEFLKQNL